VFKPGLTRDQTEFRRHGGRESLFMQTRVEKTACLNAFWREQIDWPGPTMPFWFVVHRGDRPSQTLQTLVQTSQSRFNVLDFDRDRPWMSTSSTGGGWNVVMGCDVTDPWLKIWKLWGWGC